MNNLDLLSFENENKKHCSFVQLFSFGNFELLFGYKYYFKMLKSMFDLVE